MLKKILFALAPAIAESQAVQTLLHALETAQIESILSTIHTPSPAYPRMSVPVTATLLASPGDCLMVTDSATEIAAAKKEQILCIGYAHRKPTKICPVLTLCLKILLPLT